jgi:hypothetical protein
MADDRTIDAGAPEIEISPEMMEAGADELYQDDWCETKEQWAARVFRAMTNAKSQAPESSYVGESQIRKK